MRGIDDDGEGLLRNTERLFHGGQAVEHRHVGLRRVTGANLGQPLGIVMLNPKAVALAGNPAARADLEHSLAEHLRSVNAALDPHEQLACLVIVTTAWTVDNDLITPTFKVKRNRIDEVYVLQYERWESSGREVIWQTA